MTVSIMFKTVSESCNLACDYCYYSRTGGVLKTVKHIEIVKLKKLMTDYMNKTRGIASFIWQGGEPLLAGLRFFEEVISLEAQFAPPNTSISNAIQTNGTLINDRWAAFFKQYNFLVGVSLDGPPSIHNSRRVSSNGMGSFDKVMNGIRLLVKHQVDYNILSVIHEGNVQRIDEIMDFYLRNNMRWIQFLPAMKFHSQDLKAAGTYEITPEQYGQFLCDAFDIWYKQFMEYGKPTFSVRFIDNVLSTYIDGDPGFCMINNECSETLIVEQDGDVFPCDFLMGDRWKLGNVGTDDLETMMKSDKYKDFMRLKPTLPHKCTSCKWKSKCYGGCPRNRKYVDGKTDVDFFCGAYMKFYEYTETRMKRLARMIKEREM